MDLMKVSGGQAQQASVLTGGEIYRKCQENIVKAGIRGQNQSCKHLTRKVPGLLFRKEARKKTDCTPK